LFEYRHRVLPEEVDAFLVVNFANYLKWCSGAFIEFLNNNSLELRFNKGETEFRVARISTVYLSSARLNDNAIIKINSISQKLKCLVLSISIYVEDILITRVKMTIAFVNSTDFNLTNVPDELIKVITENEKATAL
jgi:YbgC/YbaW family acyl-CoA thioester hydrolase